MTMHSGSRAGGRRLICLTFPLWFLITAFSFVNCFFYACPVTKRSDRQGKNWENYSLTSMFIEKSSVKSSLIYSKAKLCDFISVTYPFKKLV